jgi:hypothetical protein
MEQWTAPACGSIRIKKATTLQSWIDKGWYQREIDNGYTFAPACGRFRVGKCECSTLQKAKWRMGKESCFRTQRSFKWLITVTDMTSLGIRNTKLKVMIKRLLEKNEHD